jgi:CBS domain containing-hemolysin-like protein
MIFEWMNDPAAWAGLATLIVLEIILGIDNLVFIAILADKLPEHQRDKARIIGLSLALFMRLGLLASVAWIVTLIEPLFSVFGHEFSGRDLILLFGGFFLVFKGTMELHERLEGPRKLNTGPVVHAVFWQVLVQIVVLDAVFSLDSVITAVGMVDHLSIMMIAVVFSVIVMLIASKPLTQFVGKHPTVVVLCLGFLLMIGLSLIAEGFGLHLPKGYLYAAIGFSILVEVFNQLLRSKSRRVATMGDLRDRTADAVLALLGGRRETSDFGHAAEALAEHSASQRLFAPEEKDMIQGVLTLAERPAKSVMTPRREIAWLDLDEDQATLRQRILDLGCSRFPIGRGSLDQFIGVALAKDLLNDLLTDGKINLERSLRQPLVVHERMAVLRLMEQLRRSTLQMAIVLDEYGSIEGLVTPIDILEAIAGEFPDDDDDALPITQQDDGSWMASGWVDVRRLSHRIGHDLVDEADRYSTLSGFLLWQLGTMPTLGAQVTVPGLLFQVMSLEGRGIDQVRITPQTGTY